MGPSGGSSGSRGGGGLGFQELFAKFRLYFQGPWSHRNLEGPEAVPGIECIRERAKGSGHKGKGTTLAVCRRSLQGMLLQM